MPIFQQFILLVPGGQYMVVDCGGGTVDITVHEVSNKEGHIKEVFKATGGPYGSTSGDTHTQWNIMFRYITTGD